MGTTRTPDGEQRRKMATTRTLNGRYPKAAVLTSEGLEILAIKKSFIFLQVPAWRSFC